MSVKEKRRSRTDGGGAAASTAAGLSPLIGDPLSDRDFRALRSEATCSSNVDLRSIRVASDGAACSVPTCPGCGVRFGGGGGASLSSPSGDAGDEPGGEAASSSSSPRAWLKNALILKLFRPKLIKIPRLVKKKPAALEALHPQAGTAPPYDVVLLR